MKAKEFIEFLLLLAFFLLIVFFFYSHAFAHPIDRDAPGLPQFGTDDPAVKEVFDTYWHLRRLEFGGLVPDQMACWGAVHQLQDLLKLPRTPIPGDVGNYYNVLPAHPCEDRPGDIGYCQTHIDAANRGIAVYQVLLAQCEYTRQLLEQQLRKKLKK